MAAPHLSTLLHPGSALLYQLELASSRLHPGSAYLPAHFLSEAGVLRPHKRSAPSAKLREEKKTWPADPVSVSACPLPIFHLFFSCCSVFHNSSRQFNFAISGLLQSNCLIERTLLSPWRTTRLSRWSMYRREHLKAPIMAHRSRSRTATPTNTFLPHGTRLSQDRWMYAPDLIAPVI
jgi:hypothetical protein